MASTRRCAFLLFLLLIWRTDVSAQTWSHPGLELESRYADAALAFNTEKYKQALDLLEELLRIYPEHVQALELKALTLKTLSNDTAALPIYERLLKIRSTDDERAPYHFEIGLIDYRAKKTAEARDHLEKALSGGFNLRASHFFLGSIAFSEGRLEQAEQHFGTVAPDGTDELSAVAHYYLGVIQYQSGLGVDATRELVSARDLASTLPQSTVTKDLKKSIQQALQSYQQGQWFGNLALLTQYDGNVSLISTSASAADASGKTTAKTVLSGGIGYVSSPLRPMQWTASYRMSYNKNLSAQSQGLEFFSNAPAVNLTFFPLSRTHFGFKTEANHSFRNSDASVGRSFDFRQYFLGVDVGPYLRSDVTRRLQLTAEMVVRPQKYFEDSDRNGLALAPRLGARYQGTASFLNPSLNVGYEDNRATGADYISKTISLDFGDEVRLGKGSLLNLGLSYGISTYSLASRSDKTLGVRASWVYEFRAPWSMLIDASFTSNASSNADVYSYTRPLVSTGISYTL